MEGLDEVSVPTDTTPPDRNPRLLDAAQEQLAAEIMMSIDLAVEAGHLSLTSAEGAVAMVQMRLEAIICETMAAQVDAEAGMEEEDEDDPNAFLRRPRGDTDTDA